MEGGLGSQDKTHSIFFVLLISRHPAYSQTAPLPFFLCEVLPVPCPAMSPSPVAASSAPLDHALRSSGAPAAATAPHMHPPPLNLPSLRDCARCHPASVCGLSSWPPGASSRRPATCCATSLLARTRFNCHLYLVPAVMSAFSVG